MGAGLDAVLNSGENMLTRKALRNLLLRRRNERIAESRDDRSPVLLRMHPATCAELELDGDPEEFETMRVNAEFTEFAGIPIVQDPSLSFGQVEVDWPMVEVSPVPPDRLAPPPAS